MRSQNCIHPAAAGRPVRLHKWDIMPTYTQRSDLRITLQTLLVGAVGAGIAFWLSFPVYLLTGPAILVAVLSLTGMRFSITPSIWNAALLVIGLRIGAGVNDEATAAFLRWPFAFLALTIMLFAIMKTSSYMLVRVFGFDKHSAVLASTPGHLSFVLSLGADMKSDLPRISTVQAVRILVLTMLVPFGAKALEVGDLADFPQALNI